MSNKQIIEHYDAKAESINSVSLDMLNQISSSCTLGNTYTSNQIMEQLDTCDAKQLSTGIPNPFAGSNSIDQIQNSPEKLKILSIIVQFVHHYAKHTI